MVRNLRNNNQVIKRISVTDSPRSFNASVSKGDRIDIYRFNLRHRSGLNLSLNHQNPGLSLVLYNNKGQILNQFRCRSKENKKSNIVLEQGTYYLRLSFCQRTGKVSYRMRLSTNNTPPTIMKSSALKPLYPIKITNDLLQVIDAEQQSRNLTYTLTALPKNGFLKLRETPLIIGSQFTQVDIDNERVIYTRRSKITELTPNGIRDISTPQFSVSNAAWIESRNVFFYNDSTQSTTNIGNNASKVLLSGSNVFWEGYDATNRKEIYLYNAVTNSTTQLTKNELDDSLNQVFGSNVVWASGGDTFLYDVTMSKTTKVSDAELSLLTLPNLKISDNNLLLKTSENKSNTLLFYSGMTDEITQVVRTTKEIDEFHISGSNLLWKLREGYGEERSTELFFYDGTTGETTQLTKDRVARSFLLNQNPFWEASDGNDQEIFFYDASTGTTQQLTSNTTKDSLEDISFSNITENNVVWIGFDLEFFAEQIFFYEGITGRTTQVTNNEKRSNIDTVSVSDDRIIWSTSEEAKQTALLLPKTKRSIFLTSLKEKNDRFSFNVSDGANQIDGTFTLTD
jgi:Cadherin-like